MNPKFRRILHRLFFACLALGTLLALLYAEENWRGARDRATTERGLSARGEPVQAKDLIPPFVPDWQNLAMAPIFTRAFKYQFDHRTGLTTFGPREDEINNPTRFELENVYYGPGNQSGANSPRPGAGWRTGHRRDLVGWQEYYRNRRDFPHAPAPQSPAADILLAQSRYDNVFDELARAAAERPLARFPVNWTQRPASGINLPHCHTVQTLVSALSLRASCHLAAGRATEARHDLELAFRFAGSLRHEPILISHLVQVSCLGILTQPLWEGLEARQWSADDLEALGNLLRPFDLLLSYQQSLRGELALFVAPTLDDLRTSAGRKAIFLEAKNWDQYDAETRRIAQIVQLCPQGWLDLNVALAERLLHRGVEAADPVQKRVFLDRQESFVQVSNTLALSPSTFALRVFLPVYQSQLVRAAQAQTSLDQAVTACALERYFGDHQAYPANLAELVPAYLERVPVDPIDGAPLRYRLTADDRFQLYSVGADAKDDGGAIEWPSSRPAPGAVGGNGKGGPWLPTPEREKGDWVWQYAPAEPPRPPENRSRLESRP